MFRIYCRRCENIAENKNPSVYRTFDHRTFPFTQSAAGVIGKDKVVKNQDKKGDIR